MELKDFVMLSPKDFKEMRKKAKMTMNEVAQHIGVTIQAIYYIEAGTNKSPETKMKLALLYEAVIKNKNLL